jgi:hypothetical protein
MRKFRFSVKFYPEKTETISNIYNSRDLMKRFSYITVGDLRGKQETVK